MFTDQCVLDGPPIARHLRYYAATTNINTPIRTSLLVCVSLSEIKRISGHCWDNLQEPVGHLPALGLGGSSGGVKLVKASKEEEGGAGGGGAQTEGAQVPGPQAWRAWCGPGQGAGPV